MSTLTDHHDDTAAGQRIAPGGAKIFFLGSPLRFISAFTRKKYGHHTPSHFLVIQSGHHEIIVEASHTGSAVHIYLDDVELM